MLTQHLPLIADRVTILGGVNQTPLARVYNNVPFSTNRRVYRLDRTSTSLNIVDDSTPATSGTTNAWTPFGNNPIPSSATLKVYDSADGVWASNQLTLTQGGIESFKATGWNKILFGQNTNRKDWRPSYDPLTSIPARKYIRFELDDGGDKDSFVVACGQSDIVGVFVNVTTAGNTTTAPRLAEIVLIRRPEDIKWVDDTTTHAGDISTSYTPTTSTRIPLPGSETIMGFDNVAYAFEEYLFRKNGAGATWKVYASGTGSTWIELTDYASGSNFHQSGPTTLATTPTHFTSTWTPPSGWTKRSLGTLNLEDDTTHVTPSLYYVRFVLDTSTQEAPQQTSSYRTRVRQYGNANTDGYAFNAALTIRAIGLHMRGAKTGTGDRRIQLANVTRGASRTLLIPSATTQDQILSFDIEDLPFSANEKLSVINIDGGASYADVTMILEA